METTNSNKLALAVLGTLLATMALGIFTNALFAPNRAVKAGYALPAGQEAAAPAAPANAAPEEPLPALLAKADATKGAADIKACQACHNFQKGAAAKVGPPLYGVVGRPVAAVAGFGYSDTLKKMGGAWTYEELFGFIKSPTGMEPGTKMSFPGEPDAHKRADILAYLQSLSDDPVPFPK
jgi:cytochrome c